MAANANNTNPKDLRAVAADTRDGLTGDFVLTNPEAEPREPATVGELLLAARESAGLSQADVANRLRMGIKQVDALERADYVALPSGTFLRGFVRNYAKVVSVPVEQALATLERTHTNAAALNASPVVAPAMAASPINLQKRREAFTTPKARVLIVAGVILLLAAAAWYWWANVRPYMADGGRPKPPEVAATVAASDATTTTVAQPSVTAAPSATPLADPATPATPTPTDAANLLAPAAPTGADNVGVVANLPPPAPPATAVVQSTPTDADIAKDAAKAKRRPTDTGLIGFTFSGQSWVEIVDGTGRTILSRRYNAGEAEEVSGRGPFSITVGNATATRMAYNGREFDLDPHRRSNSTVARVTVK